MHFWALGLQSNHYRHGVEHELSIFPSKPVYSNVPGQYTC